MQALAPKYLVFTKHAVSALQVQKVLRILVEEHGLTDEHLELLWALTEKAGPACLVACSAGVKGHPDPVGKFSRG